MSLQFRTIALARDSDICVLFRRDSYTCSFGDGRKLDQQSYLDWLAIRIGEFPIGFVHVWRDSEIIGQRELRPHGYINLFYLIPAVRGSGLADSLHDYALSVFAGLGLQKLQLSVSPSNARAIAFYLKHGWRDLGPRPGHDDVRLMELTFTAKADSRPGGLADS